MFIIVILLNETLRSSIVDASMSNSKFPFTVVAKLASLIDSKPASIVDSKGDNAWLQTSTS